MSARMNRAIRKGGKKRSVRRYANTGGPNESRGDHLRLSALCRASGSDQWAEGIHLAIDRLTPCTVQRKRAVRNICANLKVNHRELLDRDVPTVASDALYEPHLLTTPRVVAEIEKIRGDGCMVPALPPTRGLYSCGSRGCRSEFTRHWQRQSRSGDEGMTVTVECAECGYRYKLS